MSSPIPPPAVMSPVTVYPSFWSTFGVCLYLGVFGAAIFLSVSRYYVFALVSFGVFVVWTLADCTGFLRRKSKGTAVSALQSPRAALWGPAFAICVMWAVIGLKTYPIDFSGFLGSSGDDTESYDEGRDRFHGVYVSVNGRGALVLKASGGCEVTFPGSSSMNGTWRTDGNRISLHIPDGGDATLIASADSLVGTGVVYQRVSQ